MVLLWMLWIGARLVWVLLRRVPEPGGSELRFHDEGVLARVIVIALAPADHVKAERLVEATGFGVGRPHLEEHRPYAAPPCALEGLGQHEPADTPAPVRAVDRDVGDVDLVGDLPQAEVADDQAVLPARPAPCGAVLLD